MTIEQATQAILNVLTDANNVTDTEKAIDAIDNWEWTIDSNITFEEVM